MDEDPHVELERLRANLTNRVVEHLARSGGSLATPGDEVARLRRDFLRGLSGKEPQKPHRKSTK